VAKANLSNSIGQVTAAGGIAYHRLAKLDIRPSFDGLKPQRDPGKKKLTRDETISAQKLWQQRFQGTQTDESGSCVTGSTPEALAFELARSMDKIREDRLHRGEVEQAAQEKESLRGDTPKAKREYDAARAAVRAASKKRYARNAPQTMFFTPAENSQRILLESDSDDEQGYGTDDSAGSSISLMPCEGKGEKKG